eukprot:gene13660-31959_t
MALTAAAHAGGGGRLRDVSGRVVLGAVALVTLKLALDANAAVYGEGAGGRTSRASGTTSPTLMTHRGGGRLPPRCSVLSGAPPAASFRSHHHHDASGRSSPPPA